MTKLFDPQFHDDEAARAHFEALRWNGTPSCGRCGVVGEAKETSRPGRYRCNACRKDFTVTTGTVMESSHIGLSKWAWTFYQMAASKKGISAHQVHRTLGITYRSAWFLCHRVREAMKVGGVELPPMGGAGKIVEADETYFGRYDTDTRPATTPKSRDHAHKDRRVKRAVVALVERGGNVRSFHVASADKETVANIVMQNVDPASRLHTDESRLYVGADEVFASHETVKHSAKEYVRGDVHTNSAEGYFGVFKKGMKGVYQHCGEKHLHRYLAEFDFRHNTRAALGYNDAMRATQAMKGAEGKRLTYRRTNQRQSSAGQG